MLVPFGEYRPDVADFQGSHSKLIINALPRGDGYGPIRAPNILTSALPARCRGMFYARKTDGTISIFAGTSVRLYQADNTALTWTDVSKGTADYSTLPATDNWQFAQFGNYVIAVQANTAPQYFDLTVSTAFDDLSGSPPSARYISVVGRFLVLSGLTSNANRVHWSGLDDVTTWTAGVTFSNFVDFPDGGVVRGVAGGEFGLILQESATRRMVYSPGATPAFQIERVGEDVGLLGPYSLIRAGSKLFWYSQIGFQAFLGDGTITPIGKERVDRTFAADLDTGSLHLLIGSQDPTGTRVFWGYKSLSGSTGLFDKILIYDYVINRWSVANVMGEYIGSMTIPGITLEGLDSISSSIDALLFSLDDVSSSVLTTPAVFNSDHKLCLFSGDNQEAILETPEQSLGDAQRVMVNGIRPISDAGTVYGSLQTRSVQGVAAVQTTESAMNAVGVCPQRIDTRYARARLRIPSGTNWTFISGCEPQFTPTGQR